MNFVFTNSVLSDFRSKLFDGLRNFAFKKGDFKLSSGKTSNFFIDCKQYALSAMGHYLTGALFYEMLKSFDNVRAVAGVEVGGCSLASATSMYSLSGPGFSGQVHAIYVRKKAKEHGSGRMLEGNDILPDRSEVVLLEDVITTGKSTIKAVEVLREHGYVVNNVFVLVDREEGGLEEVEKCGVKVYSIFNKTEFLGFGR